VFITQPHLAMRLEGYSYISTVSVGLCGLSGVNCYLYLNILVPELHVQWELQTAGILMGAK
jgi:hypothetical protein